jgi:hypothetical protein
MIPIYYPGAAVIDAGWRPLHDTRAGFAALMQRVDALARDRYAACRIASA